MIDVAALNRAMLDRISRPGLLETPRIREAFEAVHRHLFLPDVPVDRVYSGDAIPTRRDASGLPTSSSSEPGVMAVMLEQLQPAEGQRWLEIGAGSGYNAAVIASLVRPDGQVTTVDIQDDLAREADEHLRQAGFAEVRVVCGDGWLGVAERAPFDRIEVTASVVDLSPHWIKQLAPGGLIVVPLRIARSQALVCFRKSDGRLSSSSIRGGGFMALRGEGGWTPAWPVRLSNHGWTLTLPAETALTVGTVSALIGQPARISPPLPLRSEVWPFLDLDAEIIPIMLSDQPGPNEPPRNQMLGVLDARGRCLVASDSQRLVAFGPVDAERWFRDVMTRVTERRRCIEAVPAGSAAPDGAEIVLRRTHYDFAFRSC